MGPLHLGAAVPFRAAVIAVALCWAGAAHADPALEQAVALFRDHKPAEASRQLTVLLSDPDLDPIDHSRARYYLARSLHNLGLVQTAQLELLTLMQQGPEDPYFLHALPGMLTIARQTGDPAALLTVVDAVEPANHPPLVQASLHYLQGLGAWERGDYARAGNLLERVPNDSELYPRARYLQGLILSKFEKEKSAVAAFRSVADAAPRSEDRQERDQLAELAALATLQIGRIYDELGDIEQAEHFYAKVQRGSAPWDEALEAMARIDLEQGDPSSALRRSMSSSWPVLARAVPRTAELLHAQALTALCRPGEARAVLRSFDERALPLWTQLAQATAPHRDERGAWQKPSTAWANWTSSPSGGWSFSTPVFEVLLGNQELAEAAQRLRRIEDELRLLEAQDTTWKRSMVPPLRRQLEGERARLRSEGGLALLEAMADVEAELGLLLGLSEALRTTLFQTDECSDQATQQPSADPDAWGSEHQEEPTLMTWPFTGEIWADEI